jgi:DNA invertase Pin-like site-specific DNA recombinase
MAQGKRFELTKHQAREVLRRVEAGETTREIVLSYNVDHSTINRPGSPPRFFDPRGSKSWA